MKRNAKKKLQNGDQQQDKSQYAFTNPTCPQQTLSPDNQAITTQFTRRTCSRDIRNGISEFGVLMFYRVVRLTPAYLFVIGINQLAFRYVHDNSVFELNIYDHVNCDKNWWRNILYINNFFPQSEMCMLWSWYMANDTQFYVVGAILILLSKRYRIYLLLLCILVLISCVELSGECFITFSIFEAQYGFRSERNVILYNPILFSSLVVRFSIFF